MPVLLSNPTWLDRALNSDEAEYPQFFDKLVGALSPGLNQPFQGVLEDLSGRQNHGVLTNMDVGRSSTSDWVMRDGRWALSFDGTDDYVVSNLSKDIIGTLFSFSLWINPTGGQTSRGIFQVADSLSSASSWMTLVRILSGQQIRSEHGTGTNTMWAADNVWSHVAITYDGTTYRLYVDGILWASLVSVIDAQAGPKTWLGNGAGGYYSGLIDDFLVLSRVLSAVEVWQLFFLGRGGWAAKRPLQFGWEIIAAQSAAYRQMLVQHMGQVA